MKKIFLILLCASFIFSCAAAQKAQEKDNDPAYLMVIADRLSYHLSNYISTANSTAITQSIYLEMHYPKVAGILVFDTEGKYIDGFMKEEGEIKRFAYTVYFREPENTDFIVKKIVHNKRNIGVIKLYYSITKNK